ncbi:type II toxin-antitoxin system VapC family toxin [Candidatus Bathyarchaeota archaeon]|nr:MAG: type II toxin-antitoxin system VapC family toxin [Candidatus Bathyarchaeota archaeon]
MPTEPRDQLDRKQAVVLDSFAWIEYFNGTSAGEKVQGFLETGRALTPAIVVAELSEKHKRLNREFGPKYDFMNARTSIVPLEEELARAAGELNFERKKRAKGWGMADSIVLATARRSKAIMVTGDPHFKDLADETIFL